MSRQFRTVIQRIQLDGTVTPRQCGFEKQVAEFKQTLFGLYKQHLEMISRLPDSVDEEEEYEEVEEVEEVEVVEETAEPAAETAADSFDSVAQSTFGSRRDDFKPNF